MAIYQVLADVVLALHVGLVVFVVGGLVAILVANLAGGPRWSRRVNGRGFRVAHLGAIGGVVIESWLGIVCPLTTLEMHLRERGRGTTYAGGFVEHWLQRALYFDAPGWVFTLAYSLFGAGVVATWWFFPPVRAKRLA